MEYATYSLVEMIEDWVAGTPAFDMRQCVWSQGYVIRNLQTHSEYRVSRIDMELKSKNEIMDGILTWVSPVEPDPRETNPNYGMF